MSCVVCGPPSRTDSKSITRMKSGQMFAKEDLIRGRKLLHDGALQLKTSAGRLKGGSSVPPSCSRARVLG